TTNSTPSSLEATMLLTALPPAPPTPSTVIRGRSSVSSGALRLIAMLVSLALFYRACDHHYFPTLFFSNHPIRLCVQRFDSSEQAASEPADQTFAPLNASLCQFGIQRLGQHRRAGH